MTATQAPTPGPLDSESVKLLVKGDYIRGPNGKIYRLQEWGDGGFLIFIDEPHDGYLVTLCAFIGRPDADGWVKCRFASVPDYLRGIQVEAKTYNDLIRPAQKAENVAWSNMIAFRLAPTAPVEVPDGMMTIADELEDKADELNQMDARGQIWGLEDVSDIMRRAATALRPAPVASGGQHSSGEDAAWSWLNRHVECDPADRDYSADEMVDAFMAGAGRYDIWLKALERIAGEQQHRSGYCQTDITVEPALTAEEAQTVARDALSTTPARAEAQDEGAAGKWPEVTDQWAETYCDLTGQNPDGAQVSFIGDGAVTTTFRDKAKRQIEAMLCAAPKAAVRAISPHPSPTPAADADADRVREALEVAFAGFRIYAGVTIKAIDVRHLVDLALAALTPTPAAPVAETAGEAEQPALNIICDPGIITGLHTAAEARDWIEKSVRAALLSKKKPTSEEVDARRRLINLIEQWDGESEYDAEDIASLADDILHAFNGSPVLSSPALGYVSADAETALKAGVNRVIYPAPSAHASFPLYSAPVPAQDDDKLRKAAIVAKNMADNASFNLNQAGLTPETATCDRAFLDIYRALDDGLKSTAAKEGGEV